MARTPSALSVYLVAAGYRPPLAAPESFPRHPGEGLWLHLAEPGAAANVPTLISRLIDARGEPVDLIVSGRTTGIPGVDAKVTALPRERASEIRSALSDDPPGVALFLGFETVPAFVYGLREAGVRTLLVAGPDGAEVPAPSRLLSASTFRLFDRIAATTDAAAQTLLRHGAPEAKVGTIGRLEDTAPAPEPDIDLQDTIAQSLGGRPAWLAAGLVLDEVRAVLDAQRQANGLSHRLLLVIAPREASDGRPMAQAAELRGYNVAKRSEGALPEEEVQILIADVPEELPTWYRIAPITLMAGSLVASGNTAAPDAPAALGSAILYGPEIGPHRDAFDHLASLGGARLVHSGEALGAAVSSLLAPDKTAAMAHAAWIETSRGAEGTDRVVDLLMAAFDDPNGF